MTTVPETAFPDPTVRAAAQAIVDKDFDREIKTAADKRMLDYVGPEGDTLLHVAIMGNNLEAVRMLLKLGANPSLPVERAPIGVACSLASYEIIEALVMAGADVNGRVGSEPAIWRAALSNRINAVRLLLKNGAAIDASNREGESPAIAAAQAGHFTMASELIERGASPFVVPLSGMTLAFWTEISRLPDQSDEGRARNRLIELLKQRGHPWPPPSPNEVLEAQAAGRWPPN